MTFGIMETQPIHTKRKGNDSEHTVVSSQLRYWARFMLIPKSINKSLDADIQALVWDKDIKFDADEDGTEKVNRRFMKKGAEYNSTQELRKIQGGITKTITDYNNGTQKIKFIPHKGDVR